MREFEHGFFEEKLSAASECGDDCGIFAELVFVDFQLAVELRRKSATLVGTRGEVAMIENGKAAGIAAKNFAEDGEIFGLALAAEPLDFVFVAMGAKAEQRSDARVEPANGVRKIHSAQRADFVAFAEGDLAAAGAGAAVEGENERAIEIRRCSRCWRRGRDDVRSAGT